MRVTQSMLSNNMLRNLNNSYNKMSTLQDQLATGSKLNRPSNDPVGSVKAMGYNSILTKNARFTRNITEVTSYLEASDSALSLVGSGLQRVKELTVQAATDTVSDSDREAIRAEIDQIRQQFRDVANTQVGDKYIFSGSKTLSPLYPSSSANAAAGQTVAEADMGGNNDALPIELYDGITLDMNSSTKTMFKQIDDFMSQLQTTLSDPDTLNEGSTSGTTVGNMLETLSKLTDTALIQRAQVGAKENRIDAMVDRLSSQKITTTKAKSDNEDVEYEEAITQLTTEQSIHQAALSVGAKIIQTTLINYL